VHIHTSKVDLRLSELGHARGKSPEGALACTRPVTSVMMESRGIKPNFSVGDA